MSQLPLHRIFRAAIRHPSSRKFWPDVSAPLLAWGRNISGVNAASPADWQPGHRVLWLYRFSRDSFPAGALDEHVRIGGAYFDLLDTEYAMRKVEGGTELSVTMRYRVSTPFNWYAGAVARFLVGNFEQTALRFYGHRALAVRAATAQRFRQPSPAAKMRGSKI
jgi:hypothetical protein